MMQAHVLATAVAWSTHASVVHMPVMPQLVVDVSPAWPPQPSEWAFVGGDWLFNTSSEGEWAAPPNLRDANLAFYTAHALTSFNVSYEWRWPYHGSDGWGAHQQV